MVFISVVVLSSRFFKSLRNFTVSDNASKATYVAEALAENILAMPEHKLIDYINNGNCTTDCYLAFEDGADAFAKVELLGNSSSTYKMKLRKDTSSEINLEGYNSGSYVDICWEEKSSITAMYMYESGGDYQIKNYAYNAVSSEYSSTFDVSYPNYSYPNCFRVTASNTPVLIRLRALYEDASVSVIPDPGSPLPNQGYLITSLGRFSETSKKVLVFKRYSIAEDIFDYVLYQKSMDTALSK
jgi:hypothetical protein